MARSKIDVTRQQARLKLKSEELQLRLKKQETAERLSEVKAKLRSIGGRIR